MNKVLSIIEEHVKELGVPMAEEVYKITRDPFKVLVSTILSARTRDETTSRVCKELFKKIKKPSDLKKISLKELRKIIKPINFYKNKSRYLKELSSLKRVPDTLKELVKLPGVGRKTANIVLNVAFGKPSIAVDTHVHRVMNRLGYVKTKKPKETEKELREKLPKKWWSKVNYLLVLFGQHTCTPISPWCSKCPVREHCPQIGVTRTR
ncbi:endonuclease III [archaeon]|nr:endonuclease III [archaeon]